jgi:hypothetical protein
MREIFLPAPFWLAAGAAAVGKRWPELPVTRTRAVLAALIERIEASVNQIEIRLRPRQLNALLDVAATPIQGVIDDETEIVSVPVRLRRAGREIRMVIDGTDPFAASKPDARLIKLLLILKGAARIVTVSEAEIRQAARSMFQDTRNLARQQRALSSGLPARSVGEEPPVEKSDLVDQEQTEGEADQSGGHTQLQVKPGQTG